MPSTLPSLLLPLAPPLRKTEGADFRPLAFPKTHLPQVPFLPAPPRPEIRQRPCVSPHGPLVTIPQQQPCLILPLISLLTLHVMRVGRVGSCRMHGIGFCLPSPSSPLSSSLPEWGCPSRHSSPCFFQRGPMSWGLLPLLRSHMACAPCWRGSCPRTAPSLSRHVVCFSGQRLSALYSSPVPHVNSWGIQVLLTLDRYSRTFAVYQIISLILGNTL